MCGPTDWRCVRILRKEWIAPFKPRCGLSEIEQGRTEELTSPEWQKARALDQHGARYTGHPPWIVTAPPLEPTQAS